MAEQVEKYHPRLYQLDELISDLYNAVYAKNGGYQTKFIDVSDLKMVRFKLEDYDLDVIFEKTKIQYAGKFPTGLFDSTGNAIEQIHFKRQGETHMSTIRIIPYENKAAVNNMADPVNVNQIIKTLLSELVVNDKTNNVLLPIINVDVIGEDLVGYDKVKSLVLKDKFYSIQITEKYYSLTTLDSFLREYPLEMRVLKSIIYQAVDTLYQISTSYSGFRYNQFVPLMIDCYIKKNDDIFFPQIKLSNFFLSEIEEIVPNDYPKKIPNIGTPYSDLYQLLNYLWNNHLTDIKKYPDLVSLFNEILPEKIRSKDTYLTVELWDTLTDDEKINLRIKNIRNNTSFTSKDSLLHTTFVEPVDVNQTEISTGGEDAPGSDMLTNDFDDNADELNTAPIEKNILEDKSTDIIKKISIDDDDLNTENAPDSESELSSEDYTPEKDLTNDKASDFKTQSNKKYYNNDIDNMSDKSLNKKNNRASDSETRRSNNITEETERTEERKIINKPSRIINTSDTDMGVSRRGDKTKLKTYHGRRQINMPNTSNIESNTNRQINNPMAYDNNSNIQLNGNASRINAIGSLLGVNPNDYAGRSNSANYGQIPQQFGQQQYPGEMNQSFPSPNPIGQPQMPIQNQMPMSIQNQMPMSIQNQIPAQNPYGQQMVQGQPQLDANMMAALMQQQQQQQQQQMGYPQMANMSQTGGSAKRNPFFFR